MKKNEKIALVVVLILIAIFACITAFVKLNIGNEFGGRHPAIILRKTADSIFVVPLSSQKPDSPQKYHVKIEKVYGFKNMERWTNVLRLQNVSIQRIDMTASIGNVKGTVLDAINDALKISHIF